MRGNAAISLPLLCPDCSAADGEPSCEACGELAGSDARMCQDKAAACWDKRLNAAYQQVGKNCRAAQCRKKFRNAERAWITYRNLMAEAAGEAAGGHEAKGAMRCRGYEFMLYNECMDDRTVRVAGEDLLRR